MCNSRTWMKALRMKKGLSQTVTGEKLGMSQTYYSMIESGQRKKELSLELATKIAELFDVPLDTIIAAEKEAV